MELSDVQNRVGENSMDRTVVKVKVTIRTSDVHFHGDFVLVRWRCMGQAVIVFKSSVSLALYPGELNVSMDSFGWTVQVKETLGNLAGFHLYKTAWCCSLRLACRKVISFSSMLQM